MKKMLLVMLFLIAVPARAGEAAVPAAVAAPAPQLEAMQSAPTAVTRVVIELKGSAKRTSALLADLEKEAVYKEAACSKKSGKTATITCAKANSGLMEVLLKNVPPKVLWTMSAKTMLLTGCATGCYMMPCPVTNKCCSIYTHQPCY